jgi:CRISPR system Cascade subunit CasD
MADFLRFRLYGPFASWGETPGAEIRATALHPTRSALLGLVAAALGLDRHDDAAHTELARPLRFAVRVDAVGVPLVDYHTAQILPLTKKRAAPNSRAEQIDAPRDQLSTVVTERHYRADAAYTVVAWQEGEPGRFPLEALRAALASPHFTLSLGRKANVLAWPLAPTLVSAETVAAVLAKEPDAALFDEFFPQRSRRPGGTFWDGDPSLVGLAVRERHERRDEPLSRRRQTFTRRFENHSPPEEPHHAVQSS